MKQEPRSTPLLALLRELETDDKRQEFAMYAGISVLYLYQLAGCHRKSCSAFKALEIENASINMNMMYGTRIVTMAELATMCSTQ